jgi:hypothetical protein
VLHGPDSRPMLCANLRVLIRPALTAPPMGHRRGGQFRTHVFAEQFTADLLMSSLGSRPDALMQADPPTSPSHDQPGIRRPAETWPLGAPASILMRVVE